MERAKLLNSINYIGQEKALRKLLILDKKAKAEEVALMTQEEVCELIAEDYKMIYSQSEIIGLVKNENWEKVNSLIVKISR